jgi:Fructose-1-6-bisphosphatase, C-terminal domain
VTFILFNECYPIAFILEKAGTKATKEKDKILDIKPKKLQRSVIYIGFADLKFIEQFKIFTSKDGNYLKLMCCSYVDIKFITKYNLRAC